MKLWELYIAEREGAKTIYTDHSFVTYKNINESEIFVMDLFVEREFRKSGLVQKMWDDLIEKENPKIVYGMTDRTALNWESSNKFMLSFGFTPYSRENTIIYYYMEIE